MKKLKRRFYILFLTKFQISKFPVFESKFQGSSSFAFKFWNAAIIWQIPTSEIDQNQFLSLHVKVYCRSKAFFVLSKLQLQGLLQMKLCILSCIDSTMCWKYFWSNLNFCTLFPFWIFWGASKTFQASLRYLEV